jgi:hypothetical protein
MVGFSELKLGDSAACGAAKRLNRLQLLLSASTAVFVTVALESFRSIITTFNMQLNANYHVTF